ncbi:hypothetical protein GQ53DRAFT_39364 [Thozetella sp. PMI_491]|nr:hypothetical protein GQ53DRAFT_39364 [Thozetella sp. PMI_491]
MISHPRASSPGSQRTSFRRGDQSAPSPTAATRGARARDGGRCASGTLGRRPCNTARGLGGLVTRKCEGPRAHLFMLSAQAALSAAHPSAFLETLSRAPGLFPRRGGAKGTTGSTNPPKILTAQTGTALRV